MEDGVQLVGTGIFTLMLLASGPLAPDAAAAGTFGTLLVEGDVRATSHGAHFGPFEDRLDAFAWGWVVAAAGAGVIAVGGLAVRERAPRPMPPENLTPLRSTPDFDRGSPSPTWPELAAADGEECLYYADLADEGEQWGLALEWLHAAADTITRPAGLEVHQWEAFCLERLGLFDLALEAYAHAADASGSGEPEYRAAALLLSRGDVEGAAARLALALERSPELLPWVEEDGLFEEVRGTARFRGILRQTRARLAAADAVGQDEDGEEDASTP